MRATNALYFVMSPPLSAWLSHYRRHLPSAVCPSWRHRHSCRPNRARFDAVLVHIDSLPCLRHFLRWPHSSTAHGLAEWFSFQLKNLQCPLTCLWSPPCAWRPAIDQKKKKKQMIWLSSHVACSLCSCLRCVSCEHFPGYKKKDCLLEGFWRGDESWNSNGVHTMISAKVLLNRSCEVKQARLWTCEGTGDSTGGRAHSPRVSCVTKESNTMQVFVANARICAQRATDPWDFFCECLDMRTAGNRPWSWDKEKWMPCARHSTGPWSWE